MTEGGPKEKRKRNDGRCGGKAVTGDGDAGELARRKAAVRDSVEESACRKAAMRVKRLCADRDGGEQRHGAAQASTDGATRLSEKQLKEMAERVEGETAGWAVT